MATVHRRALQARTGNASDLVAIDAADWRAPAGRAAVCVLLVAVWAGLFAPRFAPWTPDTPLPPRAPLPAFDVLFNQTPVALTVTAGWEKQPLTVPAWRVESDWTLWRAMRFDDWSTVPAPVREVALTRMLRHYSYVLTGPGVWRGMDAFDWELVPSPVRAMAFLRMVDAWILHYQDAARFDVPDRQLADTIGAIIMVESWFEHNAVNAGPSGNRDLGLAQASDSCRRKLARLAGEGRVDFAMQEDDYFDPWNATRVATFWFLRLLGQAHGDLDLAVRAYHRGIVAARRGAGEEYLANVVAKGRTYMRNHGAAPAWAFVFARARFADDSLRSAGGTTRVARAAALRQPSVQRRFSRPD